MNETTSALGLDSRCIRARFARAAEHYDRYARIPEETLGRLLEHLDPIKISPALVVDLGAATGSSTRALARRYRRATVIAVDAALPMLARGRASAPRFFSRHRHLCADAASLPLAADGVDLVFASGTLAFIDEPHRLAREAWRVLKPGGLLMFATYGPATLTELRQAWAALDGHPHVHTFLDMHDLGDVLVREKFSDVVMDGDVLTVEYRGLDHLLADLQGIGATNAAAERSRGLFTPRRLDALRATYPRIPARAAAAAPETVPATIEIVYAHAWKPDAVRGARDVRFDPVPGP